MVAIKKAKKRESGAPIITVPLAKVKLSEVELRDEPLEMERKDGSGTFTIDPGLNARVEIVDDNMDGEYDGVQFFQNFKCKWNEDDETWEVRDGTSLGALIKARYGANFFDDDADDFDLDPDDFDGFAYLCKIVPKKNPANGQEVGSMCHHETIVALPSKKKKASKKGRATQAETSPR